MTRNIFRPAALASCVAILAAASTGCGGKPGDADEGVLSAQEAVIPSEPVAPVRQNDAEAAPGVPPEAQAAVNGLMEAMQAVADAGKKETCLEVLDALNAMRGDAGIREKLEGSRLLGQYGPEIQDAISRANNDKMLTIAVQMMSYQHCETAPERPLIDAALKDILSPIAPPEAFGAQPEAAPAVENKSSEDTPTPNADITETAQRHQAESQGTDAGEPKADLADDATHTGPHQTTGEEK